ncbi:hypothetical protein [Aneurinibacillus danicus]|uniref:Uncharacterized protein n=1 Tax=Aneurinibacillus danicus TaxID=267746 RepID=A0A511V537_9BACL|nr:hypothetical protein [Aneurinibacillus danicus]GEN34055.1 hypothetical protein ADA01nite_15150 [Aneurinibacillus danicus]
MIFGISYAEWIGYLIVVVLVFLFGLPNGWLKRLEKYYSNDHLHQPLRAEEVSAITLQTTGGEERLLNGEEQDRIVTLFNNAKLVQKMEEPAGEGATLKIMQKDRSIIEIIPYRNDFIVRRPGSKKNNTSIAYWAKQDTLTEFLREERKSSI